MSTRSHIAMQDATGHIHAVYCHNDGYLSWVGKRLLENFNTVEKVKALLDLGNISSLGTSIEKPEGHTFENRISGYTVFYGRDRGEKGQYAVPFETFKAFEKACDEDYTYLFVDGAWQFRTLSGAFAPLTPELCIEK